MFDGVLDLPTEGERWTSRKGRGDLGKGKRSLEGLDPRSFGTDVVEAVCALFMPFLYMWLNNCIECRPTPCWRVARNKCSAKRCR